MAQIRIIAFHPSQMDTVAEKAKAINEKDQLHIYFLLDKGLNIEQTKEKKSFPITEISLDNMDYPLDIEKMLKLPYSQGRKETCTIYLYPYQEITANASYLMHQLIASVPFPVEVIFEDTQNSLQQETEVETSYTYNQHDEFQTVLNLISSGNYQSAKQIVENWPDVPTEIKHLLQFGYSMYNQELHIKMYNTVDMIDLLMQKMQELGYSKNHIGYIDNLKKLRQHDQLTFIYFIHNYLVNLYENNDLIDFVVLYYRLAEEALLYAIGLDYYTVEGTNQTKFRQRKNASYSIPFKDKRLSNHYHDYMDLLEKRLQNPSVKAQEREVLERYSRLFNEKRFSRFLKLRHEGVSGHGFADFSKVQFEKMCEGAPLDLLDEILEKLDLLPPYSFFSTLNEVLQQLVRHYQEESQQEEG